MSWICTLLFTIIFKYKTHMVATECPCLLAWSGFPLNVLCAKTFTDHHGWKVKENFVVHNFDRFDGIWGYAFQYNLNLLIVMADESKKIFLYLMGFYLMIFSWVNNLIYNYRYYAT